MIKKQHDEFMKDELYKKMYNKICKLKRLLDKRKIQLLKINKN